MSKQRKVYTPEFKLEVVLEGLRGEKPIAQLCREKEITDSLYYKWRDQFLAKAPAIFAEPTQNVDEEVQVQIIDLERMVGKLALENEILKKAKSLLSGRPQTNGRL
jgi:transposase